MADTTEIFPCVMCGSKQKISFDQKDFDAWNEGTLIQDALPYLSIAEREMLITGICGDCWNVCFPKEWY